MTKKKLLGMLTAIVCASSVLGMQPLTAKAETYSDTMQYGDYLYYWQIDEDEDGTYDYIEISDCDESATEIEIPAEIDGLPVTYIRSYAFLHCTSLTSITIPNSVESFGGSYSFSFCESLESINVSENNEYYSSIDGVLFSKDNSELIMYPVNKSDESYTIPETVKSIGWDSFLNCKNLVSIMIPDNVEKIGLNSHLYNMPITIGSKKLLSIDVSPDNMYYSSVDGVLFNKDKTILLKYPCQKPETSYTIPESVVEINDCAFSECGNLKTVLIKDNISIIGASAFENCTSLQSVIIPDSVTAIQAGCFKGCFSLVSVKLSEKLTRIWGDAFKECTSLKSLQIPASVEQIDTDYCPPESGGAPGSAFYKCTSLENIKVDPDNTKYADIDGVLFNKEKDCIIYYPAGKSNTEYSIPEGITSIEDWAFAYGVNLKNLIIPDSVMSIDHCAFLYRTGLENIYVSENSEYYSSIDGVLFNKEKTMLIKYPEEKQNSEYIIPDNITSIYYHAFFDCTHLQNLTIPDSVTSIGWSRFHGNTKLESITILNPECEIYDHEYTIDDSATIYGYENSTAHDYAIKYDREFVSIDGEPEILKGDADGNGKIAASDAAFIAKLIAKASLTGDKVSVTDYPNADYNGDGKISAQDAALIAKYVAEQALKK